MQTPEEKKGQETRRAQPREVGTSLHIHEGPSPDASGAVEVALGHMRPAWRSWLLPAAPGTGCGGREPRGSQPPGSGGHLEARRCGCASLPEESPACPSIGATICSLEGWRPGRRRANKVSHLTSLGEPLEKAASGD